MKDLDPRAPHLDAVPASVTVIEDITGMSGIQNAGCAAVILHRQPMPVMQSWLSTLEPDKLPRARVIVQPERVFDTALQICDHCGTPDGPLRAQLLQDISDLAIQFAAMMKAPYLRLRLDAITTNACRKFHIDAITARLVCTYRGQTTQLGEVEAGQSDPTEVISVPPGCPVVLRGTKWDGDAPTPLRHRSPPIEGTGETRLLLVLDPIYDMNEDL